MIERPIAERDPIFALYAEQMAKELKIAPVRPRTTVQAASTQAILDRPKELDEQWQNRPLPESTIKEAQALKAAFDSGDPFEIARLTKERNVKPDEFMVYKAMQRSEKNTTGQSTLSATTEASREAAINAFLCSPGLKFKDLTFKEKQQVLQLSSYEDVPPPTEEPETRLPWYKRLFRSKSLVSELDHGDRVREETKQAILKGLGMK